MSVVISRETLSLTPPLSARHGRFLPCRPTVNAAEESGRDPLPVATPVLGQDYEKRFSSPACPAPPQGRVRQLQKAGISLNERSFEVSDCPQPLSSISATDHQITRSPTKHRRQPSTPRPYAVLAAEWESLAPLILPWQWIGHDSLVLTARSWPARSLTLHLAVARSTWLPLLPRAFVELPR